MYNNTFCPNAGQAPTFPCEKVGKGHQRGKPVGCFPLWKPLSRPPGGAAPPAGWTRAPRLVLGEVILSFCGYVWHKPSPLEKVSPQGDG